MAREARHFRLTSEENEVLRQLANAHSTPQALAFRARLVLRFAQPDMPSNDHVAEELGCHPDTVSKSRRRFRSQRLEGLDDLPRSGRPVAFSP